MRGRWVFAIQVRLGVGVGCRGQQDTQGVLLLCVVTGVVGVHVRAGMRQGVPLGGEQCRPEACSWPCDCACVVGCEGEPVVTGAARALCDWWHLFCDGRCSRLVGLVAPRDQAGV